MRFTHPFAPLVFKDSKLLILGTFPSLDSFKYNFYYAHKRNQFWQILADLFQEKVETKEQKIALLQKGRIALWDIVASCERQNSSDTNLKACILQDIPSLLARYKNIEAIAFTGQKAAKLYQKEYRYLEIAIFTLPSPSPAYAAMCYEQKREVYRELFTKYNLL